MRNHWAALKRFLSDARLPIDNNEAQEEHRSTLIHANPCGTTVRPNSIPLHLRRSLADRPRRGGQNGRLRHNNVPATERPWNRCGWLTARRGGI